MAQKHAVVGIDLGSSGSLVAYVGKGIVDLVQNEVSSRVTPTLVGFTDRERLLGDKALEQIKSNAKNTCRNFKHLLGRKLDAKDIETEKFWSTCPLATADDDFAGYCVNYKGESRTFSAVEITAMYLTKLREVTEKWCQGKVADAVISVPSYVSDVHRQALLDAARIAGISVLRLMNEHTATALAYGIYRTNDFDAEKPLTVAFCSMGHSLFSVSVVQFVRGKLTVVCEKSEKVGGRDMDECLMREFAAQFNKKHGCDPLSNKKAAFKLEDAVGKCKKTLSANYEAPCNVECLMEDEDFSSAMTRDDFERMCQPMMGRVQRVIDDAKAMSGMTVEQFNAVEVVGGASRVPWVKKMISDSFGGIELSTTMNADESVARGCALQAAILSPLYKVREFKVEDAFPYAISLGWMGSAADTQASKDDDGDTQMVGGEGEYKTATVFPENSMMNVLKMLTFYRYASFDMKVEYVDPSKLLHLTPKELGTYKIELPTQAEAKKIKVKVKLTLHGTFSVESAQMVEEEEVDETVKEKRELPPDPAAEAPAADAAAADAEKPADGDAATAEADGEKKEPAKPKEPEKKYEWVEVVKKKKRTKRTDLKVTSSGVPGIVANKLAKLTDAETAMQVEMADIIETNEKRNDLETYIYSMRDKIQEGSQYGAFITAADREKFNGKLGAAETWLDDNFEAKKVQYVEKLDELKALGDVVLWRFKEDGVRGEWISAVEGTVTNYRKAAENPGDKYSHIASDKLGKIVTACNELEKWLSDMKGKQEKLAKSEKPVLICAEMEKKNQELAATANEVLKEPKPAPPKEDKKEEKKADEKKDDAAKAADAGAEAKGQDGGVLDVD